MSEHNTQDENSAATEQNSMVQRIALELKGRNPSSIKELVLDNCARSSCIQGLTDEFCNLRVLSIINVGLQSLAKFPTLPKLRKLYLSDNRLNAGLENLVNCVNLTVLVLAGNKFKSLDELKPLSKLSKLTTLDLMNCEVTSQEDYRKTVFEWMPQLKYLDNADREGEEKDSEDEDEDDEEEEDEEFEEENESGASCSGDSEDENEEEEDESKTGLKALYNGTFEEGDDDEESYEQKSDEEDEDEESDSCSEDECPGADNSAALEQPRGALKRKRAFNDQQDNSNTEDDGPPRKV